MVALGIVCCLVCCADYLWYSLKLCIDLIVCFFFFKQKTAYEMRISDWSSDVCSSDLGGGGQRARDAYLACPVLDLDFRKLRVVEQLGERANERRIDRKSVV